MPQRVTHHTHQPIVTLRAQVVQARSLDVVLQQRAQLPIL